MLAGDGVTVRPGRPTDVAALGAILTEESVARWWGQPASADEVTTDEVTADLLGTSGTVLLVIEVDGQVAGGIQYCEENDPQYRHAGIDIYLSSRFQDRGVGTTAVRLVARFLCEQRGHHRLTIDPAATNTRAIRCYEKVGFRPVGIMRRYERGPDGRFHDGLLMDLLRDDLE
ncbi:GNAT family N-acetyltransferase [Frankia sp. Cas3]|uniref:GNAT family N-acetyltransferase n=1 Tax=Frankia sp. Cas3 TaxID=3073926 RepID=UPI003A0FF0FC